MDHFTSGSPKRAWGAAARMSVASSSSTPPPTQSPLTAATIGLAYASYFRSAWLTTRAVSTEALRSPLMSAPAQNARLPAPVSTMHRQGPLSSSSHRRPSSAIMARVIALSRGWLSMGTTAPGRPCSVTRISTGLGSGDDHDLAVRLAVGQELDRLDGALEGQSMADAGPELALGVPRQERPHPAA